MGAATVRKEFKAFSIAIVLVSGCLFTANPCFANESIGPACLAVLGYSHREEQLIATRKEAKDLLTGETNRQQITKPKLNLFINHARQAMQQLTEAELTNELLNWSNMQLEAVGYYPGLGPRVENPQSLAELRLRVERDMDLLVNVYGNFVGVLMLNLEVLEFSDEPDIDILNFFVGNSDSFYQRLAFHEWTKRILESHRGENSRLDSSVQNIEKSFDELVPR